MDKVEKCITIQIPTYNQSGNIINTINSVRKQNTNNLNIIVADDNSPTYNIIDYIKNNDPDILLDSRVKLIINPNNLGRVANYNNLLYKEVDTAYFMNLDGDDSYFDTPFVDEALSYINREIDNGYTVSSFEYGHNLNLIKQNLSNYITIDDDTIMVNGLDYLTIHARYKHFLHANCIFNVEIAKQVNFYNHDVLSIDYYSALKLYTKGYIIFSSKPIFKWNIHDNNASFTANTELLLKEISCIKEVAEYCRPVLSKKSRVELIDILYIQIFREIFVKFFDKRFNFVELKALLKTFRLSKYHIKFLLDRI